MSTRAGRARRAAPASRVAIGAAPNQIRRARRLKRAAGRLRRLNGRAAFTRALWGRTKARLFALGCVGQVTRAVSAHKMAAALPPPTKDKAAAQMLKRAAGPQRRASEVAATSWQNSISAAQLGAARSFARPPAHSLGGDSLESRDERADQKLCPPRPTLVARKSFVSRARRLPAGAASTGPVAPVEPAKFCRRARRRAIRWRRSTAAGPRKCPSGAINVGPLGFKS